MSRMRCVLVEATCRPETARVLVLTVVRSSGPKFLARTATTVLVAARGAMIVVGK